jgi:hypothetical protein
MPLQTQAWVGAVGHPQVGLALPAPLPAGAAAEVSNAIGQLATNNFFGAPGPTNVTNVFNWWIDRQTAPTGYVNISVQRNGVGAPSTVASVFVPAALNIAPGPGGPAAQPFAARIKELERAVRRGLEESFASYAVGPPADGSGRQFFKLIRAGI